ncbi:aminotransferase class V-fold PLP-dependent enzyme [Mobilitalea sibirica]|uniref:cysteine desulfurase n=1 Tax=Mobilitalea sibirica TaxID=1462919 RepID=A0A8J7HB67_9FIRM|nr:aminotransferase class V-fold PLP-dependent enzyme [Mobilitalea sibirica]MBH1939652.1 aminotransferase class V-fold PLP-dependent enzyme [Mobilitalea sibirica]
MIYLDNAATSWPKPPSVAEAMTDFMDHIGANPGRAGHRLAVKAGQLVYLAREAVAEIFHAPDPLRIVFGYNITESLNLGLKGILNPGDHVITSSMEHNSMIRPLRELQKYGVELSIVKCDVEGRLSPSDVEAQIRSNTKLIAITHASNVVGTLIPIRDIGAICRKHDILMLVDTAQSAGSYPIDMQRDNIDLLGFTGHKSLCGPTGTGGLIIGERVDEKQMKPLIQGGTGSYSEHEEQPFFLPDAMESGTLNGVGLAGLIAGIEWIQKEGLDNIRHHDMMLTQQLINGLLQIPKCIVYGTHDARKQTSTVSFNIKGMASSEVGLRLDEEYDILCRIGLHCAPMAHKTIGTFPNGTVRFGISYFNTNDDIKRAIEAVAGLSQEIT